MPSLTPAEVLKELVAVTDSPFSSRSEIRAVVAKLEKIPMLYRGMKDDPLREALNELLMGCAIAPDGIVMLNGNVLSIELICNTLGRRADLSITTRIGKMMSVMGYTRLQKSRSMPGRFRAPRSMR